MLGATGDDKEEALETLRKEKFMRFGKYVKDLRDKESKIIVSIHIGTEPEVLTVFMNEYEVREIQGERARSRGETRDALR